MHIVIFCRCSEWYYLISHLQHSFGISETVSCVDLVNSSCVEEYVIYKAIVTLLSLCVQTILCFSHLWKLATVLRGGQTLVCCVHMRLPSQTWLTNGSDSNLQMWISSDSCLKTISNWSFLWISSCLIITERSSY